MKSFIVAICIGTIMVVSCTLHINSVESISKQLIDKNSSMISFIEADDFENAKQAHKEVSAFLEDKHLILAATGNHTELDQMQIYLSQISEYIEAHHKGDALAGCKALMIMFKHLPKNYRIKAENIL